MANPVDTAASWPAYLDSLVDVHENAYLSSPTHYWPVLSYVFSNGFIKPLGILQKRTASCHFGTNSIQKEDGWGAPPGQCGYQSTTSRRG